MRSVSATTSQTAGGRPSASARRPGGISSSNSTLPAARVAGQAEQPDTVHLRRTRRTSVTASLWNRRASWTRTSSVGGPGQRLRRAARRCPQRVDGDRAQRDVERLGEVVLDRLPARRRPRGGSATPRRPMARISDVAPSRSRCWRAPAASARRTSWASRAAEGAARAGRGAGRGGRRCRRGTSPMMTRTKRIAHAKTHGRSSVIRRRRPERRKRVHRRCWRRRLRRRGALDHRLVDGHDLSATTDQSKTARPLLAAGREGLAAPGVTQQRHERAGEVSWVLVDEHRARPRRRRAPGRTPGGRWPGRRRPPTSPR